MPLQPNLIAIEQRRVDRLYLVNRFTRIVQEMQKPA